jgi:hypothetical protein
MTARITHDVTTISVRISEKEKAALKKHGRISQVVKEAIDLYLSSKESKRALRRLKELQRRESVKTSAQYDASLIREDRLRR